MTHSLYFVVDFDSLDKARKLKESFVEDDDFRGLYSLVKYDGCAFNYCQKGQNQPFIYFPKKGDREEGVYKLVIETGSHVDVDDSLYAFHWYFFTLAFLMRYKKEIEEHAKVFYYHLEGRNEDKLDKAEMLVKITEGRSVLDG